MIDCVFCYDEGCELCFVGDTHLIDSSIGGSHAYCSDGDTDGCSTTFNRAEATCEECLEKSEANSE